MSYSIGFIEVGDEYKGDGHIFELYKTDSLYKAVEVDGKDGERNQCGPIFYGKTREQVRARIEIYYKS